MSHTYYYNASGLPNDGQFTTASDLAILARHLAYDFPQYFHYFSTPAFTYRGETHVTHDNLLGNYEGTDWIKTGYTDDAGHCLLFEAVRNGRTLIGVVLDSPPTGPGAGAQDAARMLNWGFRLPPLRS